MRAVIFIALASGAMWIGWHYPIPAVAPPVCIATVLTHVTDKEWGGKRSYSIVTDKGTWTCDATAYYLAKDGQKYQFSVDRESNYITKEVPVVK